MLFWQNDPGGESYKVLRGKVRVVLTANDDGTNVRNWKKGKEVAQIPKGDTFGGMSKINPSHKRTATCVAIGNVKLQVMGVNHSHLSADINAPVVHALADKEKEEEQAKANGLKEIMENVTFADGDYICREGEIGDCFFIITSGSVDVHVAMEDDGTKAKEPHLWFESGKLVASMSSGEIFGERAVLSNNPVRTASCIAKGQVKILKMHVTLKTLVDNKELKQLLERRRTQLNKQAKNYDKTTKASVPGEADANNLGESDEEEEGEDLTPRKDDYDQYEHDLISALDDALDNRSLAISQRRNQSVQVKEAEYLDKRMHADEAAIRRSNSISSPGGDSSTAAFNGNYDDLIESGLLFSDDSDDDDDEEDGGMDAMIASALKGAKKSMKKVDKKHHKHQKPQNNHHHHHHKAHDDHSDHKHKQQSELDMIIKTVSDMGPDQRIGGGWESMQVQATQAIIDAIHKKDKHAVVALLTGLCCKPGGARTDQLAWSAQENNGPLVDINKRDHHGLTALHHAAHVGSLSILDILVDTWKADLGAMDNGYSVWAHALNSVSKGLGCTVQVLDWLKIRGAENFGTGVVADYTKEFRQKFEDIQKKKDKEERKAAKLLKDGDGHHHCHHHHSKHKKDKKRKHKHKSKH